MGNALRVKPKALQGREGARTVILPLPPNISSLAVILTSFPFKNSCLSPPPPTHPRLMSSFSVIWGWKEARRRKKNIYKLFLKDPSPMDDALCRVQRGGWQSAEPHAEITVFELVRKVIEKQTSVSLSALWLDFHWANMGKEEKLFFFFLMGKSLDF